MIRELTLLAALALSFGMSTLAQSSFYAGQEERKIKALSSSETEGYLNGAGMGFAKAAELNHYPGPKHVLDLSEKLSLSREQEEKTQKLYDAMKQEAVTLGKKLITKEKHLDRLFAREKITDPVLDSLLTEIGSIRAKIRHVHMRTHLKQKKILTPQQVNRYDSLRGYESGKTHHREHHNH
ncbi:MAG: hypothetical protein K9J27_07375 [Bacteroidales bacterium]|nr:hypothetical protein [Bacteroidales bacterium]MCF8333311.1 hypothetical protein [Bacteroidales bacterium]